MQNNAPRQIVVTGDVTIDWNIAHRKRTDEDAAWQPYDWVRACWQHGGAALLAEVVQATISPESAGEEAPPSAQVLSMAVPQGPFHPADDRFYHSYALWTEYPAADGRAWRVKTFLGLDGGEDAAEPRPWQAVAEDVPTADLVVLDDANLGFRRQRSLWPQAITAEGANPWILLKMSRPVAEGPLWQHLLEHHADRLIVIIPVTDLRRTVVQISEGLSWERTAQDVVWELKHNPRINGLSRCAHTIISFDTAGAILLSRVADEGARKTLAAESHLFFDPTVIEGMWKQSHPGDMIGYTVCLTAALARQVFLAPEAPRIDQGIQSGLAAMRDLHRAGYVEEGSGGRPRISFPTRRIAEVLRQETAPFSEAEIQDPTRFLKTPGQKDKSAEEEQPEASGWWTILHDQYRDDLDRIARQIVLYGAEDALQNVPQGRFGHLLTVDRREIESFRSIHALASEYLSHERPKRPLSIAVFGAPGSGKSFGITQVAKSLAPGEIEVLEFNLSQFDGPQELAAALHQVRDVALSGEIPLVFWDEFDTPLAGKPLGWLRYFLAPMQDGAFREGQLTHSIGQAIFVFAGGTSHQMEDFGQQLDEEGYRAAKVPDFVSRLKGYVNVLGPNPPELTTGGREGSDAYFGIRRAILLRSILRRNAPQLLHREGKETVLDIDRGLLRAFLEVSRYKHGIRSMESIVAMSHLAGRRSYERSSLPAQVQLDLHVDGEEFLALVQQVELEGELLETLARAHHQVFCETMREKGYRPGPVTDEEQKTHSSLVPFEALPEDEKAQNRAAVRDIPNKLGRAGYIMLPARSNEPPFEFPGPHLERLAKMEHARWMRQKRADGWRYAEETDKKRKVHEALLPWDELSEEERKKDEVLVQEIPRILAHAGYTVVRLHATSEGE